MNKKKLLAGYLLIAMSISTASLFVYVPSISIGEITASAFLHRSNVTLDPLP